jgi:Fanconi anemia group M protein
MDAIVLTWKIPIIPFPNIKWFLTWVIAKAKSLGSQEEKAVRALRARRREMGVEEEAIYMLEGIVGPKTAVSLLNHFGSVRNVVNANEEELMKVEGIGKKTAKRLIEVFNTEFCRTPG